MSDAGELIRPVRTRSAQALCAICRIPEPGPGRPCETCGAFRHSACGDACPACAPPPPPPPPEPPRDRTSTGSFFSSFFRRGQPREVKPVAIRVRARADGAHRCAYCHAEPADQFGYPCPRCNAWLHGDCWQGLDACPSPGCGARPAGHQVPDDALEAWAATATPRRSRALALLAPLERRRRAWGLLAIVGGLASCALGAALFQANSALAAYALTFALTVLIQVLVWPAVRWDRWRAMTHDVRRVLRDATPVPCRLSVQRTQGGVLTARITPVDPALAGYAVDVPLDAAVAEPWLTDLSFACEPVLLYGFGDRTPPYLVRTLDDRFSLVSL